MKKNLGSIDKITRIVIAIAITALYITGQIPGTLGIILIALSAIFVITSLISTCPLHLPFGISTLKKTE